ncbi:MAG: hypothetical protein Q6M04_11065, partial [Thermostichus sp. BF3_bins_97]
MLRNKTAYGLLLTSVLALGSTGVGMSLRAESASHVKATDPSIHGTHTMSLGPADEAFDLRFIDAMIPHHEGAV